MLKKSQKLNSKEHLLVLKKGQRFSNTYFQIQVFDLKEEITKCAVVIPKKIYKKAYQRNKNKRKIAQIIANIYPQLLPGKSIIVSLKESIDHATFEELSSSLTILLLSIKN